MSFAFDNYDRNQNLIKMGLDSSMVKKTGTTICGIIFKDGVVLGADTRATGGSIVQEKNCSKIHYLADHIYCCGAGTAADTDKVTQLIASKLELHRLLIGKKVRIVAAERMIRQHLFQYQGHIGAALIIGGVDSVGPCIYSIHPHGSVDKLPYTTMGSGCLASMAILEKRWTPNMELEDAKQLVRDTIAGGVFNDLGSGNNIDLCVITKDKTNYLKNYEIAQSKPTKEKSYRFKPKSTAIISRTVIPIKIENTTARQLDIEPMEE